jgi:UTP:GlnB (protein PII) uridylyltransferase
LTEVAAFFHDIGKGPKARWAHKGGKQQIDLDHPVKSAEMLVRIFTEEIVTMKKKSVRTITKLVCYHDLVGDILGRSRDPQQLEEIVETEAELDMLIALGLADMLSVNPLWVITHRAGIAVLRERVLAKLKSTEPNDDEE